VTRLLWLAALVLLASCQPLPHPFGENRPPPLSPVMSPPDAAGIVVDPVAGAPGPAAQALAEAMADALRHEDVPADTASSNVKSYRLAATATVEPRGAETAVRIDWRLSAADGKPVGEENISETVADAAWRAGDKAMAAKLVEQAAPLLAKRVEGDAPLEKKIVTPMVALKPVSGAPGDGERSLTFAIADVLKRAGIALQASPGDKPTYELAAKIEMGPPESGKQSIKITWLVSRANGGEIGKVSQQNAVPAGSLDGAWGPTAYDVALAAAAGIVELIQRAQTQASGT
jgi:hypothetical protein